MQHYTSVLALQILLLWGLSGSVHPEERASVLVIESYHSSYQWDAGYIRALKDRLSATTDLEFFQMDTKRRQPTAYPQRADLAWRTYLRSKPDLVILGDDNALKYLGPRFAKTDTPVIYLGINANPREYFDELPENITGVLERPLLKRSILFMREVLGGTLDKVLVLFDDGNTARAIMKVEFQGESHRTIGPVEVHVRLIGDLELWRGAIKTASEQGYDAIVVGLYHTLIDANGEHVPEQEIVTWSSANTTVPLFAFWRFAVGRDMTLGGLVLDSYDQGAIAADIALEVLAGGALPLIPQSSGEGFFVFSRSQLSKWGIKLPEEIEHKAIFLP